MDEPMTRREFLKTVARMTGLGALGLLALRAGLSSPQAPDPAEVCRNDGWCRPCGLSGECGLPRALSYRAGARG